jgi:site-specific recombinase XerD
VVVSIDFPVTPHMLRHTYVTRLILGGMDVRRVQYLAGHSTPDVTIQIYTDLMGHRPEDLIDDVSAVFPG